MQKSPFRLEAERLMRSGLSRQEVKKVITLPSPFGSNKILLDKLMSWENELKNAPTKEVIEVTQEEKALVNDYREKMKGLAEECKNNGIDINDVKHYWFKSERYSIFAKNNGKNIEDLKAQLLQDMDAHSPSYPPLRRRQLADGCCLVIDPADIHIGKLARDYQTGDEYDSNIAVKRVRDGIDSLLSLTEPFGVDKIVLIIGNDILHTDGPKRTTTAGTPQDTDGMWFDNFLVAQRLYVDIIEKLIGLADVHIIHNVSNHDELSGWYLAQTIQAWFRKCTNVTFDTTMRHRKAFLYHDNLIGTTHGDGAKKQDLPLLLAHEFPEEWAKSRFRNVYIHHIHHKDSKDYVGVTVESSRSASGADWYHSKHGYQHAPKAIECYLHAKGKGQFGRFSHIF